MSNPLPVQFDLILLFELGKNSILEDSFQLAGEKAGTQCTSAIRSLLWKNLSASVLPKTLFHFAYIDDSFFTNNVLPMRRRVLTAREILRWELPVGKPFIALIGFAERLLKPICTLSMHYLSRFLLSSSKFEIIRIRS